KGEKVPLLAKEVYVGLSKKFHAVIKPLPRLCSGGHSCPSGPPGNSMRPLNTQSLAPLFAAQNPVKDHARYKHRSKQVGQEAKGQCDRKRLHRTRSTQQ